jgi:LPS export ABC transporter protein LptC
MRSLPLAVAAAFVAAAITSSCGEERKSYVPNIGSGEENPTMTTTEVSTFISDSGYTRYHIVTPIWQMFEDAAEPFWKFPDGLHLEQYDLKMKPEADVVCDSARYYSRKRIWQLDGNVVMVNTKRDTFLTQQVFWDQAKREVYSDSFIHIVRSDRIIEGYGFQANEQMTEFTVHRPTGIIPVDRNANKSKDDADADTTPVMSNGRRQAPVRASERNAITEAMYGGMHAVPTNPQNLTRNNNTH